MKKFIEADFRYAKRLVHIPYFVNNDSISPDWDFERTKGVVFAGRLIQQKGISTLLKAAAILPSIPIVIFGDGELKTLLSKEIMKKNLKNIVLRGWRPQNEILRAIKDARALVMPSEWYETSGISILEAAAAGRTAIVTKNTAMQDIVKYDKNCQTFQMGSAKALACCIEKVCSDVSLAEHLGRGARLYLDRVHSAEVQYKKIKNLYSQIITKNGK